MNAAGALIGLPRELQRETTCSLYRTIEKGLPRFAHDSPEVHSIKAATGFSGEGGASSSYLTLFGLLRSAVTSLSEGPAGTFGFLILDGSVCNGPRIIIRSGALLRQPAPGDCNNALRQSSGAASNVRAPRPGPVGRLCHDYMSPLVAHSRHGLLQCKCPLSGVKRT
jgi:hypothetical protein